MSPDRARRWRIGTSAAAVVLAVVALVLVATRLSAPGLDPDESVRIVPATEPVPPGSVPENGALVDAVVQSDGSVRVTHWIRLPRAVTRLSLSTSRALGTLGRVEDLRVLTSQGQLVVGDPRVGTTPRVLPLARPTLLVRLDYTLDGVTRRSDSAPGRALVGAASLVVESAERPDLTIVRVSGQTVLSLACAPPSSVVVGQRPCGRPVGDAWRVDLTGPAARDVVLAQVDLDQPED